MKIYVAGHRGMVGSAIVRAIESNGDHTWTGATRDELELTDRQSVLNYLQYHRPDALVIAAATVGGIEANNSYPVNFLSENLQIQANLMDGAHLAGTKRVVFLGSSCIYPKQAQQPIKEEYLLTGRLEPTNEPYALAKIAGLKLIQAYRKQYQYDWISLMPTNLYGPGDNYDPALSHVIPGMIAKFCKAKSQNRSSVTLWGTGTPMREFLHVDDLARAVMFSLENYSGDVALNVGSGVEVSIRDLALKIASIVGFHGKVLWDHTKPDGTPRKLLDSSRIRSIGWKPQIGLDDGLEQTIRKLRLECAGTVY